MKIVQFVSRVAPEKCNGDKRCERLCPSGTIKVFEKIAVVREDRCVACGKCSEVCREEAVEMVRRTQPLRIEYDVGSVEPEKIQSLCAEAGKDQPLQFHKIRIPDDRRPQLRRLDLRESRSQPVRG